MIVYNQDFIANNFQSYGNVNGVFIIGRKDIEAKRKIAEMERGYILDCQCDGIVIAKSQGEYRAKPRKQIDQKLWDELYVKWRNGEITAVEFMKKVGLRKSAFYDRISHM